LGEEGRRKEGEEENWITLEKKLNENTRERNMCQVEE
jgi:hypothetical protein